MQHSMWYKFSVYSSKLNSSRGAWHHGLILNFWNFRAEIYNFFKALKKIDFSILNFLTSDAWHGALSQIVETSSIKN